jgi:hypothetical protein
MSGPCPFALRARPFGLSLSQPGKPFDRLGANGTGSAHGA